jgi:hypothetical protein
MPIFFSVGFVVESRPRRQFETVCATAYIEDEISAVLIESEAVSTTICPQQEIAAYWLREYGDCK